MASRIIHRLPFVVAIVAILAIVAGCSAKDQIAEALIRDKAKEVIGPAASYETDVKGLAKTHVDALSVIGSAVRLKDGPVVERLSLSLCSVDFRAKPFQITNVGDSAMSAILTEDAVNAYLAARPTSVSRFQLGKVDFRDGEVHVSGKVKTPLGPVPASTTGRLEAHGAQVDFIPKDLHIAGINVPDWVNYEIAARVNPLIDLTGDRFLPNIQNITFADGRISIDGTATLLDVR